MSLFDAFSYQGKRVVVVGGATGMGAAAAEVVLAAGADVIVMDRADVTLEGVTVIKVDMSDKASIEAAVAECGGPVDALLSCAGVADGTPGIERINFIGHRHMIDLMVDGGLLASGSAIGLISSAAGFGWEQNLERLNEYLAITDFDEAAKWAVDNGKADYLWSKLSINAYIARECFGLMK
ncbi:MAG: SDR family NAD(P)-dependent oxidoreductase, partial [Actinomycetota bacterium]|nr:SDR family NAD(P)-dependent oxidoreductase [Actinomycetota bacterium]